MANKKISELPAAGAITGPELVEIVKGGINSQTTAQTIANLAAGGVTSVNGETGAVTGFAKSADVTNGLAPVDTTGTAISFAVPQTYGSVATPETGNVTLVTTGLVKGCVQLLLHNHATTEPTWPTEFKRQGGVYIPAALNNIYMDPVSTTRINYWISQDIV